eukprot:CAMPEP_0201507840 /NCGR_PEP_ID=MMETSP0161_2-20130828/1380_1 /ASSEMBLY_ACC=CAM_ASM_000251 /TAXON_ID=180227 /ORGANISM="Neoparamoeba aestuarina, Strain SoJaBio B1-5/56/2" /LENGTH=349 /DNA_ID=CAMNT_0047902313 /DNA_START=221 /DNA_END=1270 /DNA_ORIENTATION=-
MLRLLLLSSTLFFTLSVCVNINLPLITNVNDPDEIDDAYGHLAKLVGTWNSPATEPTGYNVMPVPDGNKENSGQNSDWQSKNFYYYEEMTFTAPGEAPNRGQLYQQGCYGLTYEQRVYFAADPKKGLGGLEAQPPVPDRFADTLVHFENGLWLQLQFEEQPKGAYAPPYLPFPPEGDFRDPPEQPKAYEVCKQLSIPHGNSILATGTVNTYMGPPKFDTKPPNMPPFSLNSTIENPSKVLQAQLDSLDTTVYQTTEYNVSSFSPGGGVTNLVFEQGNSNVTGYNTQFFIELLRDGTTQLQYIQTINMEFDLELDPDGDGPEPTHGKKVEFLHITANTLVRNNGEECRAN